VGQIPDREAVEEQLPFPAVLVVLVVPVVPVVPVIDQSVWALSGVLTDQLLRAVVAVELAEAFPCPFTLPLTGEKCNRKGTFHLRLES